VNTLLDTFKFFDIKFGNPPRPPKWMSQNLQFFGAYLAGLIDGDGDIRVKRKRYPQCVIRISSGKKQTELSNIIRKLINCSVSITRIEKDKILYGRKIHGICFSLEFYVSSKNYKFAKRFIIPHLTLKHKQEKLQKYIDSRWPR